MKKYFFLFFLIPYFLYASNEFSPGSSGLLLPSLSLSFAKAQKPTELLEVIKIIILLTVLTLAPAILILTTGFTRIVIILSFLRQALGAGQMPPNQLLIGLSLFLSYFVMAPTIDAISQKAFQPYLKETITQQIAFDRTEFFLRDFMFSQTREKDLKLFLNLSKLKVEQKKDVPTYVLIPSFIISELKTAFQIGFTLYLPFLVLDMVVASVLMALGMMMLPPAVVSLPLKLLLFVMVDGWDLVVTSVMKSFRG